MNVQISNGMLMALIINMVYAKAIGLTQGIAAREVGGDIWIATIFATLQGCLMIFITVLVIRRMPTKDFIGQAEEMLGKWFGKLVACILFLFFLGTFGTVMITFVYHLMDYFLPEAPILLFILVAIIVGSYGIFFGLEVIGRMALVGVFSIIVLNILMVIGTLADFDMQEFLPVFESGFWRTLWSSRQNDTDWAMATMMACMIYPSVKVPKVWGKSGIAGILFSGLFILEWPMLEVGVLSPEVTGQYIVACMQMARAAHIGEFIHRYEMIMIAFFAISLFVQISMSLYCATLSASKLFGLKDYRTVILPVAIILGAFGYWVVFDHARAMELLAYTWYKLALPIAVGLPLLLWVMGFFFKSKLSRNSSDAGSESEA